MIVLEEDNPNVVASMIDFLYRYDYNDKDFPAGSLAANAHIYTIADKYEILSLKEAAIQKTQRELRTVRGKGPGFADALEAVWTSTPSSDKGLRNAYLHTIREKRKTLIKEDSFLQAVQSVEGLSVDITKNLATSL